MRVPGSLRLPSLATLLVLRAAAASPRVAAFQPSRAGTAGRRTHCDAWNGRPRVGSARGSVRLRRASRRTSDDDEADVGAAAEEQTVGDADNTHTQLSSSPVAAKNEDHRSARLGTEEDDAPASASPRVLAATPPPPSSARPPLPRDWLGENLYVLLSAVLVGLTTAIAVAFFKISVECVREACYGEGLSRLPPLLRRGEDALALSRRATGAGTVPAAAIPAAGGLVVGGLLRLGGEMPPGLRDTVKEVDLDALRAARASPPVDLLPGADLPPRAARRDLLRFARKGLAATATLGTGNSLGPEGPSVEAGMSVARLLTHSRVFNSRLTSWLFDGAAEDGAVDASGRVGRKVARDRLLLACGAAAGVSAGFNAPLSGVFFALEIVQASLVPLDLPLVDGEEGRDGAAGAAPRTAAVGGEALALQQINISALLLASVVSALTSQLLLGNELALRLGEFDFSLNPLLELPLYLVLGALAGITAAIFSGVAQFLKNVVDGDEGPPRVREFFGSMPNYAKPLIGSIVCGIVGVYVPQVLFFGYETLNGLFLNDGIPTGDLFLLLVAKLFTTALCAASGLVGGTFAPSLFVGGVLGAGFHNVISDVLQSVSHLYPELSAYPIFQGISGLPAFAMVGAASVLAALFRAPLTASLLLFECTRNYDVILPLMASAGVASLTGDIVEKWLDEEQRDKDPVSWGDLATRIYETEE